MPVCKTLKHVKLFQSTKVNKKSLCKQLCSLGGSMRQMGHFYYNFKLENRNKPSHLKIRFQTNDYCAELNVTFFFMFFFFLYKP